jgi:ankyrin repeat protein
MMCPRRWWLLRKEVLVHSLLDCGLDVNERNNYRQTALAVASMNGKLEVAELLIKHGANVDSQDVGGRTPLHSALEGGHFDIA